MISFIAISWLLTLFSSALLLFSIRRHRFLLAKPSVWAAALIVIFLEYPAAFRAREVYEIIPNAEHFLILFHFVPLGIVIISLTLFPATSRAVWARMMEARATPNWRQGGVILVCVALGTACLVTYFLFVPVSGTGLFVLLSTGDYQASRYARDESLKLLESSIPKYAYSLFTFTFARVIVAILGALAAAAWGHRQHRQALLLAGLVAFFAFLASITGARLPAALVFVTAGASFYLARGAPLQLLYPLAGLVVTLLAAGAIEFQRTRDLGSGFDEIVSDRMVERLFGIPLDTALVHIDFVQNFGFWGVRGSPRLASIMGETAVPVDNMIAVMYTGVESSSLANVSFLVTQYTFFGLWGIPVILAVFAMLDAVVLLLRGVHASLLIPTVAVLGIGTQSLVSADILPSLFTFGMLPSLLVIRLVGAREDLTRGRFRRPAETRAQPMKLGQPTASAP